MAELRCEHLAASYGARRVLDDIDLCVPEGTLTAILGASGSGKTTLLRVIMGFSRAVQGRVVIGGTVVAHANGVHLPPERRGVGYVAQEGALYPHLNVRENVSFGLTRSERKSSARVDEVLTLVGLSPQYKTRRAHELSGGEQRRVSLARALAPRPRLVLLDEPFSGIDAALRAETRSALFKALAEEGTTAVLVTHDQGEALTMGRQVAVLRDGRLVQTATPAELYGTPVDLDVARFVGEAVTVPGHASSGMVQCVLGMLSVTGPAVDGPVDVMIRPEQILIEPLPSALPMAPWDDRITATVTACTYHGAETTVSLVLDESPISLSARRYSYGGPGVGDAVEVAVRGPVGVYPRSDCACGGSVTPSDATAR